jgi:hypothetical protein
MEAFLVAYGGRELHKKSKIKIPKNEYIKGSMMACDPNMVA